MYPIVSMGKNMTTLARASFGTQSGYAYAQLREWIVTGKLPRGERIATQRTADELGMSRMPVRDALRQLASEHLVTGGDGRNWAVARFTPEDVLGAVVVREALESDSIRRCTERATAVDIERLRSMAARLDDPEDAWESARDVELEERFHLEIARIAGCRVLYEEIRRWITVIVTAAILSGGPHRGHPHGEIVERIAAGDADKAERAMREHVRSHGLVERAKAHAGGVPQLDPWDGAMEHSSAGLESYRRSSKERGSGCCE